MGCPRRPSRARASTPLIMGDMCGTSPMPKIWLSSSRVRMPTFRRLAVFVRGASPTRRGGAASGMACSCCRPPIRIPGTSRTASYFLLFYGLWDWLETEPGGIDQSLAIASGRWRQCFGDIFETNFVFDGVISDLYQGTCEMRDGS